MPPASFAESGREFNMLTVLLLPTFEQKKNLAELDVHYIAIHVHSVDLVNV